MWVDVNGGESEFLNGGYNTIIKKVKFLYMEFCGVGDKKLYENTPEEFESIANFILEKQKKIKELITDDDLENKLNRCELINCYRRVEKKEYIQHEDLVGEEYDSVS